MEEYYAQCSSFYLQKNSFVKGGFLMGNLIIAIGTVVAIAEGILNSKK